MAKILIVDDSSVMRKNLSIILKGEGHFIVGEAANGRQALIQYSELKPDLVTMDISMPIMDGVEAVKKIIEKFPEAKIIMISALNQKRMVYNAINSGAKHYIIKPIETKKVIKVVNDVLLKNENENIDNTSINEAEQGFEISNIDGKFLVMFKPSLKMSDNNLLKMAVRGILFIKPLKVEFNFSQLEDVEDKVLIPILELADEIKSKGGEIELIAKTAVLKKKFINR